MPLLLPVLYVLIECITFIAVSAWLGFGWALLALLVCFVGGVGFAWWQMGAVARSAAAGATQPSRMLGDYGLLWAGLVGVSLPGFISSIAGLLLIFPWTRGLVRRSIGRRMRRSLERLGARTFTVTQAPMLSSHGWSDEDFRVWRESLTPEDFMGPGVVDSDVVDPPADDDRKGPSSGPTA